MRILLLIVAITLSGCGRVEKKDPPLRGIVLAPDPVAVLDIAPTVHLHIMYKYAWDSFYICGEEDVVLTLQQAVKRGMPAQLWIFLAIFGHRDRAIEIYFVRPWIA